MIEANHARMYNVHAHSKRTHTTHAHTAHALAACEDRTLTLASHTKKMK